MSDSPAEAAGTLKAPPLPRELAQARQPAKRSRRPRNVVVKVLTHGFSKSRFREALKITLIWHSYSASFYFERKPLKSKGKQGNTGGLICAIDSERTPLKGNSDSKAAFWRLTFLGETPQKSKGQRMSSLDSWVTPMP